jgi:biopolymer transport protein ExbB/TolQ
MSTTRTELQQKVQSLLLQYAFFRWENAVIIALSLVLTVFLPRPLPRWPIWGWVLLGLIGVVAIVYSSLTDADANAKVLVDLMQERFNPRQIKSAKLRQEVEKGLEYQRRIEEQVRSHRPGIMRDRLEDTAGQLSEWVSNVFQLALRLDAYEQDGLLHRERENVPQEVQTLEARIKLEANPQMRGQMEQVLAGKRKHLEALRALDQRMNQAALQMDQSLTALATIYSQTRLIDAQDIASGRAERLRSDIQEQVLRLNDLVASINEVYNYQTEGLG